jgi:multidrug resistance efflux pump
MRTRSPAILGWTLLAAGLAHAGDVPPSPVPQRTLTRCLVSLIDDLDVPAERPGVLATVAVREGDNVEKGAPLGLLDDEQARGNHDVARAEAAASQAKASNDLEIEYAVATHRSAEAEYQIAIYANSKSKNSVSAVELERLRLAAEQARIKIGVTQFEKQLRALEAGVHEAQARLTDLDLRRRVIPAPVSGEVVEIFVRGGEWVEQGKPVFRVVRLDRLRIEGFVKFADLEPSDVIGRAVEVVANFPGNRVESFSGKVTFVSPLVQPGGEYRIWAEVDNRRKSSQWLLRPGLDVSMTLLGTP